MEINNLLKRLKDGLPKVSVGGVEGPYSVKEADKTFNEQYERNKSNPSKVKQRKERDERRKKMYPL